MAALSALLAEAPISWEGMADPQSQTILEIPMPDGASQRFRITQTPVMAPELQVKYPQIRTYTGIGVDDPAVLLKCDLTPWGFHAMTLAPDKSAAFVDPYLHGDDRYYVVFSKKDYVLRSEQRFVCEAADDVLPGVKINDVGEMAGDCQRRRYRLALACTGEYANFHGGTKPLVLAAMNTSMNRVNGIYEREFAVFMQLIPNNDTLIFLDAATDPYTNNNGSSMLGQNQTTIDNLIGAANYDIGHVFSTGGGGVAQLSCVCTSSKARGVTGLGSPIGDPFDVDYVAHEMGHQFGAQHTQNNNCNRVASSSMEPGSASTIMGYAGICSPNVQNFSDDYFHAISVQQISNFIVNGAGNNCPLKTAIPNDKPSVDGGPDYIIPRNTPFALTAKATDPNLGGQLTYCWEQMDPEFASMPPMPTNANGPMFRSLLPSPSPTRFFPPLSNILNNTINTWQRLPNVGRTMKFRVTVRDNHPNGGCTDEDDVVVTVADNAGPFVVTNPNTNVLWYVGETRAVTWNVANTDLPPVSCAEVRIALSTDGGQTFPFVLADAAPNTGSANVVVPFQISNTCRIKVEGVGNIFFDVSNQNFRIQEPPVPDFTLTVSGASQQVCAGEEATFGYQIAALGGFDAPVTLSVSGAPAGAMLALGPNPVISSGSGALTLSNLSAAMAGDYVLTLTATGDTIIRTAELQLRILPGAPTDAPSAGAPLDGQINIAASSVFEWTPATFADAYLLEISESPNFEPIAVALSVSGLSAEAALPLGQAYYWRVRGENACGVGPYSDFAGFQVAGSVCADSAGNFSFGAEDLPIAISEVSATPIVSRIEIADARIIASVKVNLQVEHTWVGDLVITLVSPSGDSIRLIDRPGLPQINDFGCPGDNLDLSFDDQAPLTASDLSNTCATLPAIAGIFQPITPLSTLVARPAAGEWRLVVDDRYPEEDGGALIAWSLDFCFEGENVPPSLLNLPLLAPEGQTTSLSEAELENQSGGAPEWQYFYLMEMPSHGDLLLNGAVLDLHARFTQADLNAGAVAYAHNGDDNDADQFRFDAFDAEAKTWAHDVAFLVLIVKNNLIIEEDTIVSPTCFGAANGLIRVSASGLDGNYQYRLNDGDPQDSPEFGGVTAGVYTVTVIGQFGFTASIGPIVLTQPDTLIVEATVDDADVTALAGGGTPPYRYSIDGVGFQDEPLFADLPNGVYALTVRDALGCLAAANFVIANIDTLIIESIQIAHPLCADGDQGSIFIKVMGGVPPYMYSIDGGAPTSDPLVGGLGAGVYEVVITDAQGLSVASGPIALNAPDSIVVSVNVLLNTAIVTASGGTGALTYSLDGDDYQALNVFGGLGNGDYTVFVRDENGCVALANFSIDIPPLTATVAALTPILCFGDLGVFQVVAVGGAPPYSYRLNGGAWQSNAIFVDVPAGLLTFEVRDALGAIAVVEQMLTAPAPMNVSVSVSANNASVSIFGGLPPYTLISLNGLPVEAGDLIGMDPGDYILIVSDVNGCTASSTFTVVPNPLSAQALVLPIVCHNDANGSITVCVSGSDNATIAGTVPMAPVSIPGCALAFESGELDAGDYAFTITDQVTGYSLTLAPLTLLNPEPLQLVASATNNQIDASASGGVPPYAYSIDGLLFQDSGVFADLAPGTYAVTAMDANGCEAIESGLVITSSMRNPVAEWGLRVWPNPAQTQVVIEFERQTDTARAELLDALGRHVRRSVFGRGASGGYRAVMAIEDLPEGVYLLRIWDERGSAAVRVVVAR
ncbi:MAG: reprolysin-like metallopeptidase [Saprospiraceae bacterium]